jgi:RHS repeat-associated protein
MMVRPHDFKFQANGIADTTGTTPSLRIAGRYYQHMPTGLELALYRAYDPALGRWMSEDPMETIKSEIAELWEGPNLYSYVGNRTLSLIDQLGLQSWSLCPTPKRDAAQVEYDEAVHDFYDSYNQMKEANWQNSDKYFHCMANCRAASRGPNGINASEDVSNAREWIDEHIKGDSAAACAADQAANLHGRNAGKAQQNCKAACSKYRPAGLPAKY